jgi:hypothetical protein
MPPLDPQIRVEHPSPGVTRWVLPRRDLGSRRWVWLIPIAIGFVLCAGGWQIALRQVVQRPAFAFNVELAISIIFAGVLFTTGLLVIGLTLHLIFGHSEIEVGRGCVRTIERLGPIRWVRKRSLASVIGLQIEPMRYRLTEIPPRPNEPAWSIRIHCDGVRSLSTATRCPRTMLTPLLTELADTVHATIAESEVIGAPRSAIEIDDGDPCREPERKLRRPECSDIVMNERPGRMTIRIPRRPFWFGGAGYLLFGVIWCAIGLPIAVFLAMAIFQGQAEVVPAVIMGVLTALYLAFGILLLIGAVDEIVRQAKIVLVDHRLTIIVSEVFGAKTQSWLFDTLETVRCGDSGRRNDGQVIFELQVLRKTGEKIGLFDDRREEELRWMAAHLRRFLSLAEPIEPGHVSLPDTEAPPTETRIEMLPSAGGVTFVVPRAGFDRTTAWLWIHVVFAAVLSIVLGVVFWLFTDAPRILLLFLGLIVLGMLLHALQMSIRKAVISVAHGRLSLTYSGVTGVKRHEWDRGELLAVRAGASGIKSNGNHEMQLQFVPRTGKQVGLLTGYDQLQLAWMATVLRRALDLPAEVADETSTTI